MKILKKRTASEEKSKNFFSRNIFLLLSFLLPFLCMVVVFAAKEVFTSRQILVTDLWHQYFPFLADLQDKIKNGGSMLYTWSVGMGVNFPALMSYYLASPLNFLTVFVPAGLLQKYLAVAVAAKIGFAGFSFSYFLRSTYRKNDYSIVFFSGLFALCAFFMGYYWNVIWLDTVAILPLVVSGFIALQKEGKYKLYIIALALSILVNYYVGFFICIFILLCFFCYNICCCGSLKSFLKNFLRISWTTAVALLMTAVLTIPAFAALQNTYSAMNEFPAGYQINISATNDLSGTLDAARQILSNSIALVSPTAKEGLPNIYCGMISVFFAFLFMFSDRIKLREKIVNAGLLVFFILSFIIRQLDYIWHGFHFTNMIPYRFSFLFSFVAVAMAYRAFTLIEHFSSYNVILAALLSSGVIILALFIKPMHAIIASLAIVLAVSAVLILFFNKRINRQTVSAVVCIIALGEMICSAILGVTTVSTTTSNDYPRGGENTAAMISEMNALEADTVDLWRSEFTSTQTLNDGALNNIRGVSVFSSMINVNTTKFAENFGLAGWQSGNRYCYYESSPVTNLFLNLKYIISRDGDYGNTAYLNEVSSSGSVKLLKNTAYLPMGFIVNSELAQEYDIDANKNDPIAAQNQFFSLATGINEDVYETLEVVSQGHTSDSGFTVSKHSSGVYSFSTSGSGFKPHLKYNFTMPKDGMIVFYVSVSSVDNLKLMRNDQQVDTYYIKRGYIGCADGFSAGDKISLYVDLAEGARGNAYVRCAYFNKNVFDKGYALLSGGSLKAQTVKDTMIEGTVTAKSDGLFYTSIPYEDGWKAYVDGKEAEITPVGGAMLAFPITAGEHTVRIEFKPKSVYIGFALTLIAIALLIACAVIEKRRKKPLMQPNDDTPEWFVYVKKQPERIQKDHAASEEDKACEDEELDDLLKEIGIIPDDEDYDE